MRVLETARLVLRPFAWTDFAAFHRLAYADPDVATWWTGRVRTADEVRPGFARKVAQAPGAPGWLAVTLRDAGDLVGGIGLQRWLPDTSPQHPGVPQLVAVPEQLGRQAPGGLGVRLHPDGDPLARGQHYFPVRPEAHPGGAAAPPGRRERVHSRTSFHPMKNEAPAGARRPRPPLAGSPT